MPGAVHPDPERVVAGDREQPGIPGQQASHLVVAASRSPRPLPASRGPARPEPFAGPGRGRSPFSCQQPLPGLPEFRYPCLGDYSPGRPASGRAGHAGDYHE